ncbi:MAG: ABC transporter ATP-binding protein [Asgard group archaeon]|nr:ABC transporter ATP-binding protein [Asgard group archaeon]
MGMGHMRRGPITTERIKATRPTGVLLKALGGFLKGIGWLLIAAALITMVYSATQLVSPLILTDGIDAFDNILTNGNVTLFSRELSASNAIIILTSIYAVMNIIGFFISSLSTRILAKANSILVNNIRVQLYHKLINSSMGYLKNEQSGNITARITSDTDQIATGIHVFTTIAIQIILLVATLVLLLVRTSWQIILICLGSVPVALIISAILSNLGRRIILKIRRAFGIVSGKMAESFAGAAVAKSFNREETLSAQMGELNQKYYKMAQKFGLMMFITMPIITMISSLTTAMILWAGGLIDLSTGEIFLGITLSSQFLRPITMLSMAFPELQNSLGAVDRVVDVMEAAPAIEDSPYATPLNENYSVTFDGVSFAYEDEKYVLKNIDFSVNEGEMIALVGETGAGKTTLASMLLPRFYDIQKGSIKIGKQDIRDVTQKSLRNAIGLIPQDPYLFSATVIENIKYGRQDATEDEIYRICKMIGADDFIEALPDGYQTKVVEGGKKLSAGQRQMITIARTMLSDPKILILDEATSRLDAYSESLVQSAQRILFKDRTTFVIAHRLSTIHDAKRIIVLDHGELVEQGSHEELMQKEGIYADLYNTYYSFQGLEKIELEDLEEEIALEHSALSTEEIMAMVAKDHDKFKQLVAEGKISKEQMATMMERMKEKMHEHK